MTTVSSTPLPPRHRPPTRSCTTRCTAPRAVWSSTPRPGAGKSTLVVRAALELAEAGRPLMVVAQTNAQVDDLVLRLAEKNPELPVGRLHSSDSDPYDKALDDLPNVRKSAKAAELAGLAVVLSTAAKWAHVKVDEPWRHAIVDEAYQMRSDALLAVAGLFERALFVGDPGPAGPVRDRGQRAVGGPVVRPVGLGGDDPARAQPGPAPAPPAGLLAAPGLRGAPGLGRVLPVHAVPQRHRPRRPRACPSPSPRTARARTG